MLFGVPDSHLVVELGNGNETRGWSQKTTTWGVGITPA